MVELVGLRIVLGTFPSPQSVQGRRTHNIFENILNSFLKNFGNFRTRFFKKSEISKRAHFQILRVLEPLDSARI